MAGSARSKDYVEEATWRKLLVPLGAIFGIVIVILGVVVLKDPLAGQHLLANVYELLGNTSGADQLRNNQGDVAAAKVLLAVVAIAIGVGGVWLVYTGVSALVGLLPPKWQSRILPWVFVVPAMLLLGVYLIYPTVMTFITSFTSNLQNGDPLTHYKRLLAPEYIAIFRNNIIWLVVGTAGSVGLGLLIAGLVDRVHREALAKTFIFLPLAISLVGASVIWRFVYAWAPGGPDQQYGLLNAIWTGIGFDAVPWMAEAPINTYLMILIFVWLQTGFAMVVLSAAIKGVSVEILEAARLDGASERQIFFGIIVPIIKGSIITVATTIAIAVLKIFDIVFVMTGGRAETDVVANNMFIQMFTFANYGQAAALAVVLFIAVSPIIYINVRNLNRQGIGA